MTEETQQQSFLQRKNIEISLRRYGIEVLGFMAQGLFASLIIGVILNEIGVQLGITFLSETVWPIANEMTGPAIGAAVAFGLKAPPLVVFASTITGYAGADLGGPAGALIAAVLGAEFGKIVSKETKVDIVVTPAVTILVGVLAGSLVGPGVDALMRGLGVIIMEATEMQPVPMGIIVAVVIGLTLTFPISSVALTIMLDLEGLAAGAAAVGCASQMIGFAVASYKENGVGGLIAQGLGTSMLQIPNVVSKPKLLIPPTLTAAILGPMVTAVFPMYNLAMGAGMGTSGLVGQFGAIAAMEGAGMGGAAMYIQILVFHFVAPAVLAYAISQFMRKKGHIQDGDLKLPE
ncbi:PTS transporter subunit IIC [Natranaerobius thermophilus]|uniref:Putative PTS system, EIIc component n=1 Tax=Natranaerobius thermophilus (strain ATCC BAA-1301 / DSM 18059 / JW/NM-WN-LF) TaxID=457570 RepID=B2A7K6_NATTJ|nr:PTS sugar transporter subunit IIC [Natranaerobius thermophilus]ACB85715.1 putative PTS system, EIIc component [Natranaerobius thermophilus JW/NM-WN-LF]